VAIKVLPIEFNADAGRLASFEREARVLASLNYPNIAAIHGVEERGRIRGLVLELVKGETLADLLQRSKMSGRAGIPIRQALRYAHQVAEALDAAHEGGRWDTWQVPSNGGQPTLWLQNASGLTWTAMDRLMSTEIKNENIHMAVVTSLENRGTAVSWEAEPRPTARASARVKRRRIEGRPGLLKVRLTRRTLRV
jgi:serine/threonine protein kinase